MPLTARDLQRLNTCHPHLVALVLEASKVVPFMVVEGMRTMDKQREYFAAGKSKTMRSRHLAAPAAGVAALVSHAVDLAPLVDLDGDGDIELSWHASHFRPIADAMKGASHALGYPVEWGGDWISFVDMPHFQLPWNRYP